MCIVHFRILINNFKKVKSIENHKRGFKTYPLF